jgi:TP901 family phage tail tape measure protein
MASGSELFLGLTIGASVSGTVMASFGRARSALGGLTRSVASARREQAELGRQLAAGVASGAAGLDRLRDRYDKLGRSIEGARIKQRFLARQLAQSEALKTQRSALRGEMLEAGGTALAFGAPALKAVRTAASFQDGLRDISITGGFSDAQEARLGKAARDAARQFNQMQEDVVRGMAVLTAGGMDSADKLARYAPIMSKASTATRASMDDLGKVALALNDNLKVGEDGFEGALNMLAYAGKRGQFEIRDMAKWVPALSPMLESLGVVGPQAVAEMGAALQIARKGAGSNDEAANNYRNFLQKVTSPDTLKDFQRAGIDLKASMLNLRAQGMTPMQAMLGIITSYMQNKGPDAAREFQAALALKDEKERQSALQRLQEAYKLGDLFQDMQAMAFIRPAIANMKEMAEIQSGALAAANQKVLDKDFQRRMETATEQFKAFKIELTDLSIVVGDALLPGLTKLLRFIKPVVTGFASVAREHSGLVSGLAGVVGGFLSLKLAGLGLAYIFNMARSASNAMKMVFTLATGARGLRGAQGLKELFSLGLKRGMSAASPLFVRVTNMAAGAAGEAIDAAGGATGSKSGKGRGWRGRAGAAAIGATVVAEVASAALGEGSTAGRYLGSAANGAALGATIGSVIPVIGTAVGAAIGAAGGLLFEGVPDLLAALREANKQQAQQAQTASTGTASNGRGGSVTLHYAPTLHMPPGADAGQINNVLQANQRDLERQLQRLHEQQLRVAY